MNAGFLIALGIPLLILLKNVMMQEHHFSLLQHETEKLRNDIEKMRNELRSYF